MKTLGYKTVRAQGNDPVETALDDYAKGAAMSSWSKNVIIATSADFPDALAGASLCGRNNSVPLLAEDDLTTCIDNQLASNKDSVLTGYVLGGEGVVSPELMRYIRSKM